MSYEEAERYARAASSRAGQARASASNAAVEEIAEAIGYLARAVAEIAKQKGRPA